MRIAPYLSCLVLGYFCCSCASYRQNIMFRVSDQNIVRQQAAAAGASYQIRRNDLLELQVFTNKGESVLDQSVHRVEDGPAAPSQPSARPYLVDSAGVVRFPLIDPVRMEGLSLRQAEDVLQEEYSKFYREPFVILTFTNRRVVVLGAHGGKVIPLTNENTRLTEVLALAQAESDAEGKVNAIRVMRDQQVFVADFSTIDGYLKHDLVLQPGDIIYVEPVRRPFSEGLRDYGPILSILTSITTLIIVILQ